MCNNRTFSHRGPKVMTDAICRVSPKGGVVIPAGLRRKYGIQPGSRVVALERPDGVLIVPAVVKLVELSPDGAVECEPRAMDAELARRLALGRVVGQLRAMATRQERCP